MATSSSQTYKAAVFESQGAPLKIKNVPLRQPAENQVLVKVLACGICHSDSHVQQGDMGSPFPLVPGHEVVGDVVAVGNQVTRFKCGERVGAAWGGGK
jgi:D-arabinose 1-dehydrogenase-like Zn-dependent alcohol dehydrogenase